MHFYEEFGFCPRCGERYSVGAFAPSEVSFRCGRCRYPFYQNSRPSATTVIPAPHSVAEVLLLTRATEPNLGKLALPGGILRYGEEPAEGAKREAWEETRLDVTIVKLLCAHLVDYLYLGARMSILELAFLAQPVAANVRTLQTSEASQLNYYPISDLLHQPSCLAFPEQRRVLECYREWLEFQCSPGSSGRMDSQRPAG